MTMSEVTPAQAQAALVQALGADDLYLLAGVVSAVVTKALQQFPVDDAFFVIGDAVLRATGSQQVAEAIAAAAADDCVEVVALVPKTTPVALVRSAVGPVLDTDDVGPEPGQRDLLILGDGEDGRWPNLLIAAVCQVNPRFGLTLLAAQADYTGSVTDLRDVLAADDVCVLAGPASDRFAAVLDRLPTWRAWLDLAGSGVIVIGSDGRNSAGPIRNIGKTALPVSVVAVAPTSLRRVLDRALAAGAATRPAARLPGWPLDLALLTEPADGDLPTLLVDALTLLDPTAWLAGS